jgi:hypothetical protein
MADPNKIISRLNGILDELVRDLRDKSPDGLWQNPNYPILSRSDALPTPELREYADGIRELDDATDRLDRYFKETEAQ